METLKTRLIEYKETEEGSNNKDEVVIEFIDIIL